MGTVLAPAVGDVLVASSTGRFTNNPNSYTYQWSRCDAFGNNGIDIGGATAAAYIVSSADSGHTLRVIVTATGSVNAQSMYSAQTGVVSGTAVYSAPPPSGGYFPMTAGPPSGDFPVPVGTPLSALPNDAQAALMVTRSTWEPRPHNAIQNDLDPIVPETGLPFVTPGFQGVPRTIWDRVTGLCPLPKPRTTDELIQWAAAKWGLSDEFVRSQAQIESYWFQGEVDVSLGFPIIGSGFSATGPAPPPHPGFSDDCQFNRSLGGGSFDPFDTAHQNGPDSFGLVQVKYSAFRPNPPGTGLGSYPWIMLSTAYLLDFYCAAIRAQYMGLNSWAVALDSDYAAYVTALGGGGQGDPWRTARNWFSGLWGDTPNIAAGGVTYLTNLEAIYAAKDWLNVQNGAFTATSPARIWIIGDWAPICGFTTPVVSGTPQVGFPFSGSHGSWVSWPRPTSYAYQWQRQVAGVWGDIAGATLMPYIPVAADVGNALRVGVAAINKAGTGTYTYSNASNATTSPLVAPTPITPPVIS